jgi:hypothetical protein
MSICTSVHICSSDGKTTLFSGTASLYREFLLYIHKLIDMEIVINKMERTLVSKLKPNNKYTTQQRIKCLHECITSGFGTLIGDETTWSTVVCYDVFTFLGGLYPFMAGVLIDRTYKLDEVTLRFIQGLNYCVKKQQTVAIRPVNY